VFSSNTKKKISPIFLIAFLAVSSCTKFSANPNKPVSPEATKGVQVQSESAQDAIIRSDYKKGEITELCKASMDKAKASLDKIASIAPTDRTTDNTLLAFENTTTEMLNETSPVTFMGYVSTDAEIRAEASDCEAAISQFNIDLGIRRDLYQAIENAQARHPKESRLLKMTKEYFEQNGLKLSDEDLKKVRELKGKLSDNENQFSENLNNDNTQVLFTSEELEGVPADYLADLKKDANGQFIVNTRESDYSLVMETALRSETRKKMMQGYFSRGGDANSKLLSESVQLRAQIAKLLGFKTWADYRTNGRMVQNSQKALDFLNGLKGKLAQTNASDFAKLLKFKQETVPAATSLDQWDISYYSNQLKKRDYSLDKEKIREYFPADVVIAGMFQVYSKMLGVRYEQIKDAKTWAENVQLYAIYDAEDNHLIGHFYTDFFPREGKYGHAAAWQLISGYELADGSYKQTVSAIVANLTPPMNGKPSLLDHEDVETIFHEFGHVMHETLTKAKYASMSGASVAQDFVEAPSQMLENWVWNKDVLQSISGHYLNHSEKLPTALLEKMLEAESFNRGMRYTKQLLYALYDMTLHSPDQAVDVNKVYTDLYKEIIGQEPLAGQQFPASFGHLMGGYDAGYYGYLWSEVYAQDMFTKFPENDITSPEVGARYRKIILESGGMKEALDLLTEFLGREPNSDAFFKKLGL
jgi:thimet oligopeptidase